MTDLDGDTLSLSRTLSDDDEDVIEFTEVLSACDVDYVIVSGYVAILTGRSRATEDVVVVLQVLTEEQATR